MSGDKINNAKTLPRVYYGLHMVEGVAEYKDISTQTGEPYRIFIGEQTIKNMDSTFQGRPVYVHHVEEVDLDNLHNEADGYVVRSFYNKADGKHWAEFLITSDKGHEAIRNGWKLSNAYHIKNAGSGGRWHAVDYTKEVLAGEYEHLAIVPNPRYDESIILTPDQFKDYNEKKENELRRLSNSTGAKGMFGFFKKEKVENSADFEKMSVVLPKSSKEVTLSDLIINADEEEMKNKDGKYCNGDDMVKMGEEEMTLNTLIEKYNSLVEKEKTSLEKPENEEAEEKKENEEEEEKKENEEEAEEKKENSTEEFDKLVNAEHNFHAASDVRVEVSQDLVIRGQKRYGSK